MNSLLFLCLGAGLVVVWAVRGNLKVRKALNKQSGQIRYLPQAISMLVLTAQLSELARVVEHISIVNIVAALFLLTIVTAAASGTESELF